MKKPLSHQLSFLALIAVAATFAGFFLRSHTTETSSDQASSERKLSTRKPLRTPAPKNHFQATLEREQFLATASPEEYPALIEEEIRSAKTMDRLQELARRWSKTDPEGFLDWMRNNSHRVFMPERGHNTIIGGQLIEEIEKEDPKRAWELSGELGMNYLQPKKLTDLFESNPALAKEILHENRIALSFNFDSSFEREPMKEIAILNELFPGPAQQTLVMHTLLHWTERSRHPAGVAESTKWFEQLKPELQTQVLINARRLGDTPFGLPKPLLKAWTESE